MRIDETYISMAGGGMLVLCHIGFLQALEERKVKILGAAGASAGALAAGCSASSLTPGEDLNELILSFFPASTKLIKLQPHKFFSTYGALSLSPLEKTLRRYLPKTFAEAKHPIAVFTSNVDQQRVDEWSSIKTPDADLPARVVDSCRIPGVFQARNINGDKHTDGGLVYNYPIDYWKDNGLPGQVVGVRFGGTIGGPLPEKKPWYRVTHNTVRHFLGHVSMAMDALAINSVEDAPNAHQILLSVPQELREAGVSSMQFDMDRILAKKLIESAREQTHRKLDKLEKLG